MEGKDQNILKKKKESERFGGQVVKIFWRKRKESERFGRQGSKYFEEKKERIVEGKGRALGALRFIKRC